MNNAFPPGKLQHQMDLQTKVEGGLVNSNMQIYLSNVQMQRLTILKMKDGFAWKMAT